MKQLLVILTLAIVTALSTASASERGQLLYENHCQSCHSIEVHTRNDRKVTSPALLKAWIISMTFHNELGWGEAEIADITAYLNRSIYRFPE